ncbi:MAG: Ribosomal RNA large subunit methyltransferase I [Xylophilus sp.]|nr:MAG: Ribosomal RNA large subunit methyltransferase I [Xylophilus sp.]
MLTSFAPASDAQLAAVQAALDVRGRQIAPGEPLNWVFQNRHASLRIEGRSDTRLMAGAVPEPHVVTEAGARYRVHVLRGQNHGRFLDMAAGRQWVRGHLATWPRARVLNLFAYTCAFSVVALQAGAKSVVNIDMSHGALATGQQNPSATASRPARASWRTTSSRRGAGSAAAGRTT